MDCYNCKGILLKLFNRTFKTTIPYTTLTIIYFYLFVVCTKGNVE